MKKTIALSAISAMALTGFAYSQEETSISTDFAVSYNTEYIFRGVNFGDDLYTYGVDVAGEDLAGFNWSAGIWYGQFDATGSDEELDIYGEISKDIGAFNFAVGYVRYIFPDGDSANNTEVYAGVSTEFCGFDLGAKLFYSIDADESSFFTAGDIYYELSASYGYDFTEKLNGSVGAVVAFFDADGNDVDSESGFAQVTVTAGLTYALSDNLSVNPYLAYSNAATDYVGIYNPGSQTENFFGGVSVGYSF